ncbi:hypothetical protein VNO77_05348 [Canavalia gladiata]|uniref:BZIP domain-containing protein n=1 Tax=Canavalia gladiata TaxID=3824 RepID=A0AAN9R5K9_CANGL
MASSKVVSTNPDLPRESSSITPLLLSDLHSLSHPNTNNSSSSTSSSSMDDLLKSIKTVDDVWKDIVAGSHDSNMNEEMTLEDFLTKAGAVREEDVALPPPPPSHFPIPPPEDHFGNAPSPSPSVSNNNNNTNTNTNTNNNNNNKGKRRVVEEPLDKATLQKQRRMIKNRESAARSRERKQAYTSELEYLVHQLEQENARLLNEEVEKKRQRYKQLMECIIPIEESSKPKQKLRRLNSAHL